MLPFHVPFLWCVKNRSSKIFLQIYPNPKNNAELKELEHANIIVTAMMDLSFILFTFSVFVLKDSDYFYRNQLKTLFIRS